MIQAISIEHLKVVICDLCKEETGFTAEQGYAEYRYHFCREHAEYENIILNLIKMEFIHQADILMAELKEYFDEIKLQSKIEPEIEKLIKIKYPNKEVLEND